MPFHVFRVVRQPIVPTMTYPMWDPLVQDVHRFIGVKPGWSNVEIPQLHYIGLLRT